jgi:hypothetical protein
VFSASLSISVSTRFISHFDPLMFLVSLGIVGRAWMKSNGKSFNWYPLVSLCYLYSLYLPTRIWSLNLILILMHSCSCLLGNMCHSRVELNGVQICPVCFDYAPLGSVYLIESTLFIGFNSVMCLFDYVQLWSV